MCELQRDPKKRRNPYRPAEFNPFLDDTEDELPELPDEDVDRVFKTIERDNAKRKKA